MSRGSDRRSALATTAQLLIVAILVIAVFAQVGRLSDDETISETSRKEPDDVVVVEEQVEAAAPYVTTDDVNLRSGPGTSHEVVQILPEQTDLVVTGEARQGFSPVRVDGTPAWVSTTYIAPAGSELASMMSINVESVAPTGIPVEPTVVPTEPPVEMVVETVEKPALMTVSETIVAEEPVSELEPVSRPTGEQWVEVDRSTATVTLHHGETVVARFQGLIGRDPSAKGYYSTATGTFQVFSMERALTETPFAPGVYLTDFVGFDPKRSNGFHSPTRDEDGNIVQTDGTVTMGCVRLGEEAAQQMFDFAFIGMRVEIHD